jgi:hypothetical protein
MVEIEKINNFIHLNGLVFDYINCQMIDGDNVELSLKPLSYDYTNYEIINLKSGSIKINGVLKNTSQEIIQSL